MTHAHAAKLVMLCRCWRPLPWQRPPPDVEDSLKPDHEWMLSTANDELESFRVGSIASAVSFLLHTCPHAQVRLKLLA